MSHDLGPASGEFQLGVLDSCLTHTFLVPAMDQKAPKSIEGRVGDDRRLRARRSLRAGLRRRLDWRGLVLRPAATRLSSRSARG